MDAGGLAARRSSTIPVARSSARVPSATSEKLDNFGRFYQHIVSAGWDITPRHNVVARYIRADYGSATRFAYTFRMRKNIDFFAVYDRNPNELARVSAKVVMTFQ